MLSGLRPFRRSASALTHFGPLQLSALRILAAAAVLTLVAPFLKIGWPEPGDRVRITVAGVVGMTIYQALLNGGEQVVESAPAAILIATSPIWVAVLSTWLISERLARLGWLGIAVAFAGVTVVAVGGGSALRFDRSALLILLAAIAQATYITMTKPLMARYRPVQVATWAMWAGSVAAIPLLGEVPSQLAAAPGEGWLAFAYLGVFPSALGFILWGRALVDAPASVVASTLYVVPPVAAVIAWVWLGEVPGIEVIVGGATILIGVSLVVRRGSVRG